jgi:Domain of unknown function (DUF222)
LIEEGYAMLAAESFDTQTHRELLAVQSRLEAVSWKQPEITHKLIGRLAAEATPVELGGKNLADVLATKLRISTGDARRRIKQAASLGPRTSITGEPFAPKLPHVAKAQADGLLGPEHLRVIERFFDELPDAVDYQTREQAEADLARIGSELGPVQLRKAADRLLALVHPDGDYSDGDRARRRQTTRPRVWTANRPRRTFKTINAHRRNAITTRSMREVEYGTASESTLGYLTQGLPSLVQSSQLFASWSPARPSPSCSGLRLSQTHCYRDCACPRSAHHADGCAATAARTPRWPPQ